MENATVSEASIHLFLKMREGQLRTIPDFQMPVEFLKKMFYNRTYYYGEPASAV